MKQEGKSVQLREGVPYNLIVEMKELKAEVAILKQALAWGSPVPPQGDGVLAPPHGARGRETGQRSENVLP